MTLTIYQNIILFTISTAIIWYFSDRLSIIVDYIDEKFALGSAFGGTIFLSIIPNLPEIAIMTSGSINGHVDIIAGNLLGGIVMQTILMIIFDWYSKDTKPLSTLSSSKPSMLQGLFLIIILGLVLSATQLHNIPTFHGSTLIEWVIVFVWIMSVIFMRKYQEPTIPTKQKSKVSADKLTKKSSIIWLIVASIVILVFGVMLEITGSNIASHFGLNGVIFGATVLAVSTSLPELSGGIRFIKNRSYQSVIDDTFEGNAILPTLFLPASLITAQPILANTGGINIFLSTIAIVMTSIYLAGMVIKSEKKVFRLGIDSWSVLVLYLFSVIGLLYL